MFKHLLKIWGDKWADSMEYKGGRVQLMHHRFIVTSNYSIRQLCERDCLDKDGKPDEVIIEALERRFNIYRF
jgi:hypothetical protein